jgi:hypothetical protein
VIPNSTWELEATFVCQEIEAPVGEELAPATPEMERGVPPLGGWFAPTTPAQPLEASEARQRTNGIRIVLAERKPKVPCVL